MTREEGTVVAYRAIAAVDYLDAAFIVLEALRDHFRAEGGVDSRGYLETALMVHMYAAALDAVHLAGQGDDIGRRCVEALRAQGHEVEEVYALRPTS
jgi:hypothetical protein